MLVQILSAAARPWDDDWRGCCSGGRADLGNLVYEELGEVVSTELVGGRLQWRL